MPHTTKRCHEGGQQREERMVVLHVVPELQATPVRTPPRAVRNRSEVRAVPLGGPAERPVHQRIDDAVARSIAVEAEAVRGVVVPHLRK